MQATWGGNIHQFQQRAGSNIQPFANGGGLTIPYTFTPGTVADANEVNADFNAVAAWAGTHGSIVLLSNTTFWVSPSGIDAPNNGTSPATPLATPTYAWQLIQTQYRFGSAPAIVTIQLAPGTYSGALFSGVIPGQWNQGSVVLRGDENNPGAYVFNDSISADHGALVSIRGVTLTNTNPPAVYPNGGNSGVCLYANNSGFLQFGSVVFGEAAGHVYSQAGGIIRTDSAPNARYTISGGAQYHWRAQAAQIWISGTALSIAGSVPGPTITIAGNPNFTNAFAIAGAPGGVIQVMTGTTFVNIQNATGKQYDAHNNAAILTQTMPLPGNIPGTTFNNGIYDV